MKTYKFLPLEAIIYEGIKAGKTVAQITKELDPKYSSNVSGRKNWLINNGAVIRTGSKQKSMYSVVDVCYEVVQIRKSTKETKQDMGPDLLMKEMYAAKLTDKQMKIFKENRNTLGRTALAKEMGISKLQLNHVMNAMVTKRKPPGKKLDT